MDELQSEDDRRLYQPYPQSPPPEIVPAEPTNAELERRPPRPTPAWVSVLITIGLMALIALTVFSIFPLDTWEFRFGP